MIIFILLIYRINSIPPGLLDLLGIYKLYFLIEWSYIYIFYDLLDL